MLGGREAVKTRATMLEVPGRLFTTCESVLEGRGRLGTEGGTMLEKPGTLTTGTTVSQGPMMLFTTGAIVLEWPGGWFLFLCIMESQMKLLMHSAICDSAICDFVKSKLSDCTLSASRLERLRKETCAGRMGLKN